MAFRMLRQNLEHFKSLLDQDANFEETYGVELDKSTVRELVCIFDILIINFLKFRVNTKADLEVFLSGLKIDGYGSVKKAAQTLKHFLSRIENGSNDGQYVNVNGAILLIIDYLIGARNIFAYYVGERIKMLEDYDEELQSR